MTSYTVNAQHASLHFARIDLSSEVGPNSENITALLRDSQGFLWAGTQNGLKRYDGHNVETIAKKRNDADTGLRDAFITEIVELPGRVLFVGTENGGVQVLNPNRMSILGLSTYDKRFSSVWEEEARIIDSSIDSLICLDIPQLGKILYKGNDSPILSIDSLMVSSGLRDSTDLRTVLDWNERFILVYQDGLFTVNLNGQEPRVERVEESLELRENENITDAVIHDSQVWTSTNAGRILLLNLLEGETREVYDLYERDARIRSISDLEKSSSRAGLWIATFGAGGYYLDFTLESLSHFEANAQKAAGLSNNQVVTIMEDMYDGLWVGTFDGLNKAELKGIRFTKLEAAKGTAMPCNEPLTPSITSLYEAPTEPGIVWLGMMASGLQRYDRRTNTLTQVFACGKVDAPIFTMLEDRSGQLWMGNDKSQLFLLNRADFSVEQFRVSEKENVQILQILEISSAPGFLWLTTSSGLFVFDIQQRQVVQRFDKESSPALPDDWLWKVMEDPQQAKAFWIGSRHEGLFWLDTVGGDVRVFDGSTNVCLSNERIISIAPSEQGSLWLGTFQNGLLHFDSETGACTVFGALEGLESADVGGIQKDRYGRLWLVSTEGLTVFNPADSVFTRFTEEDGLQDGMFLYPAQFKNNYGELFYGGMTGFHVFQPDSIQIPANTDPVTFTEITVSGQRRMGDESLMNLSYRESDIAFRFSSMDMRRPGFNQYRVRLLPGNEEWQTAPNGVSPRYALLSPGAYEFEVLGTNSYGIWNTEPTRLAFRIDPPFWGTWWFTPGLVLLIAGLIISAFQFRLYHLKKDKRMREEIASDLHDDIGTDLSDYALQTDWVARELDEESVLRSTLKKLSEKEYELVKRLRDTVWLIHSKHDFLHSVIERMEQLKNTMLTGSGRRTQFQKPDHIPKDIKLDMLQRKHIMLIYKEVLHNIVRHSGATSIEIAVTYTSSVFSFRIEDNGKGFDLTTQTSGVGLLSMTRRAEELHATLEIASRPKEGTLVQLIVPLKTVRQSMKQAKSNWRKMPASIAHTLRTLYIKP